MNRTQSILAAGTLSLMVLICIVVFGTISHFGGISTVFAQPRQQSAPPSVYSEYEENEEYEHEEEHEYEEHESGEYEDYED